MPAVVTTLLINHTPAGADLLGRLRLIEYEDHVELAGMVRLRFDLTVREDGGGWTPLDDGLFERLTPVRLMVTVGATPPTTLIEAYVVELAPTFSDAPGESYLDVLALDPSVLMALEEKVRAWPNMDDGTIATILFGEYGFVPDVQPAQPFRTETEATVMQRGSDIAFLRGLARRNGYQCYVEAEALTGLPFGHFHPPRLDLPAQGVLTVNQGPATTVPRFSARWDLVAPAAAAVADVDIGTQSDQTSDITSQAQTLLGSTGTLNGDRPRRLLLHPGGLAQTGELQTFAQAAVDASSWSLRADGELATSAYGDLLRAKRPVEVAGAGEQLSGAWLVERVLHRITPDDYRQHFTLRRNATGLSGREQHVRDLPL